VSVPVQVLPAAIVPEVHPLRPKVAALIVNVPGPPEMATSLVTPVMVNVPLELFVIVVVEQDCVVPPPISGKVQTTRGLIDMPPAVPIAPATARLAAPLAPVMVPLAVMMAVYSPAVEGTVDGAPTGKKFSVKLQLPPAVPAVLPLGGVAAFRFADAHPSLEIVKSVQSVKVMSTAEVELGHREVEEADMVTAELLRFVTVNV